MKKLIFIFIGILLFGCYPSNEVCVQKVKHIYPKAKIICDIYNLDCMIQISEDTWLNSSCGRFGLKFWAARDVTNIDVVAEENDK